MQFMGIQMLALQGALLSVKMPELFPAVSNRHVVSAAVLQFLAELSRVCC